MARSTADSADSEAYRLLPAIDELLRDPRALALRDRVGRELLQSMLTRELDALRAAIRSRVLDARRLERELERGAVFERLELAVRREEGAGLVRCVNATGIVLNTGLGRAPVHPEVAEAMALAARSYCVLEVERWTNERNQRDQRLGELLVRATGAEAGIGVNNCAGAVLLMFQTFAAGREALVSRGELVEIGGSFRVPDVMARANATLVEVGTTNRTRLADYERALGAQTGLLVKVHTSNFRVHGFTEEVGAAELAALGRRHGITTGFDLGSGLLDLAETLPLAPLLGDEPRVIDAVQSGVDLVCFSGDKLLGGPQAGLIVGRHEAIAKLRRNPIYRALRLDKVGLAGLEKTLELLLDGRGDELPTRRLIALTQSELEPRARALASRLERIADLHVEVVADVSQPGSGSAPGVELATFVVRVAHAHLGATQLATRLRAARVPVFARVQDERVLLDPRTLLAGDEDDLVRAFEEAAHAGR